MNEPEDRNFNAGILRCRPPLLATGAAGLAISVVLRLTDAPGFFQGYLFGFTFWVGVSLGCLALLMLHHLVAGEWGFVTQRILEAGSLTVLLMAVFFVPVVLGLHELYEWADAGAVSESAILTHKRPYLNPAGFALRAVLYFAVWGTTAALLTRWSRRQDADEDPVHTRRMRRLAAGGLIGYVILMTFASVDWVMSIEPHWYSTVFGWMLEVSQTLCAIALVVVVLSALRSVPPIARAVRPGHFHDYGNLMLAFVILWAYLMFAQYLIIWSGNIPEDVGWYIHRKEGPWFSVGPLLIVFHFAVPFALLLFRRTKRTVRSLTLLAAALFGVHLVYVAWLIFPGFPEKTWITYAAAAAASIGIGGCWMTHFLTRLARSPLLPRFDPRFVEQIARSSQ